MNNTGKAPANYIVISPRAFFLLPRKGLIPKPRDRGTAGFGTDLIFVTPFLKKA